MGRGAELGGEDWSCKVARAGSSLCRYPPSWVSQPDAGLLDMSLLNSGHIAEQTQESG